MPGVAIKSLTKRYGDVAAVEELSLDVKPGELVSLLGPSGCGKTTTLRLVAGFLRPEAGEMWVGERCLSSAASVVPPERRRMAPRHRDLAKGAALRLRVALSGRAVGRPAAACRGRPGPGRRAGDPAARRASEQPGCKPARGNAFRNQATARGLRHHDPLRHPRPGGSHGQLRLASAAAAPGASLVVSIRPHEIELVLAGRSAPAGANTIAGAVQRASYLGDAVDYHVRVNGSDVVLRVTAPPPARLGAGDTVTLAIAPEACVPLIES